MANCKPAAMPMEVNLKLKKLETAEIDTTGYQQLIGSLMYALIGTQFDITYDVGILSQRSWVQSPASSLLLIHPRSCKIQYGISKFLQTYNMVTSS